MEALAGLAEQYGLLIVVVITLLVNTKGILSTIEKVAAKIYPPWAAHRRDEREWRQGQADRSYADAVTALQDMLEAARDEVRAAGQERRILQAYLFKHLAQYEQLAAGTMTVVQKVTDVLQEQNERIAQLTERLRQVNGCTDEVLP